MLWIGEDLKTATCELEQRPSSKPVTACIPRVSTAIPPNTTTMAPLATSPSRLADSLTLDRCACRHFVPIYQMHTQVSSVFPLLSEGLMRDRHALGESTYAALLEMALLADEREVPWSEQVHVMGIVNASKNARGEGDWPGGENSQDEDLAASVWWNCEQLYTESSSGDGGARNGQVLDDAQLIRNVLPLALILQYLPIMASSVQVRLVIAYLNIYAATLSDPPLKRTMYLTRGFASCTK